MLSYDDILYGKDPEEHIVGLHQHGEGKVRVYTRDPETDRVSARDEEYHSFMWASNEGMDRLKTFPASLYKPYKLRGKQYYSHLLMFENDAALRDARKHIKSRQSEDDPDYDRLTKHLGAPETAFLTQTGKTMFKGMTPQTIKRMQIDIEVRSSGSFPNAKREEDEIIIIAMCDNRGWECILHTSKRLLDLPAPFVYCADERWMLVEFIKQVHRQDPDVLELHNGFGFDLPYLRDRAKLHKVNFALGRNGKAPRTYKAKKKFAERDYEFEKFLIDGRSIIDTMFLAIDYDVYKRDLPGVGLKVVAKHFGVAADDREYVEGGAITQVWDEDPERLLRYALHDVYETRSIADILQASTFYLTQMVPMTYQTVHTSGKASIIESLFVRQYLRQRHSIPTPEQGKQEWGGLTEIFRRGVYTDCVYADVASLYPSIMLGFEATDEMRRASGIPNLGAPIQPESDELHLFQYFLQRLRDLRFEAKNAMKALPEDDPRRTELDARQSAYKIIINSFYGMCGFAFAAFNDISEADRVAQSGQFLLKTQFRHIVDLGGKPVLCDTDGILTELPSANETLRRLTPAERAQWGKVFRSGDGVMTDEEVDAWVKIVSARMPAGINIDNDGRFERVLSYRKKNYILKTWKGKVKVKGGSFKSRGIEPFGRKYVEDVALALLDQDVAKAHEIHERTKRMIVDRTWTPDDFCKRATLKKTLGDYLADQEDDETNPQAQYELAKRLSEKTGQDVLAGDAIEYYVAGMKNPANVRAYIDAKLKSEWVYGDENTLWYLKRLKDFSSKFKDFFSSKDFDIVFSSSLPDGTINLFGDPPRINATIINTTLNADPN